MFSDILPFEPKTWAYIGFALTPFCYFPYFVAIFKGTTRPHIFSWLIWGLLTVIAFFAQVSAGAGLAAGVTGLTALFCLIIAALAWKRGEKDIRRSDVVSFVAALCALPLWWLTEDPFYTVVLVTAIDGLGFYPTFRKTWSKPWEEALSAYAVSALVFLCALFALETVNATTVIHPLGLAIFNGSFALMAVWRRYRLDPTTR